MKKLLEIKGCKKTLVIETCGDCPLLNGVIGCKHPDAGRIDFSPHTLSPVCPLPDATKAPADVWPDDENHRLGPNGEQLIAVDHVSCKACFLFGQPCYSQNAVLTCCYDYRKDKRNIHWEIAGDRK